MSWVCHLIAHHNFQILLSFSFLKSIYLYATFNIPVIDVPQPLTNNLLVFLFQTIDAERIK